MANICVYCASTNGTNGQYRADARETGRLIGSRNHTLIYGGSGRGLMGETARAVQEQGGKVVGVLLNQWADIAEGEDELILVEDMRKRKELMHARSDALIAFPGGLGTFDEIADSLVLKYIGEHRKPVVFLNTNNYFTHLLRYFDHMHSEGFTSRHPNTLYYAASTPLQALLYIEGNLERVVY